MTATVLILQFLPILPILAVAAIVIWLARRRDDLRDLERTLANDVVEGRLTPERAEKYLALAYECRKMGIKRPAIEDMKDDECPPAS